MLYKTEKSLFYLVFYKVMFGSKTQRKEKNPFKENDFFMLGYAIKYFK